MLSLQSCALLIERRSPSVAIALRRESTEGLRLLPTLEVGQLCDGIACRRYPLGRARLFVLYGHDASQISKELQ